MKNPLNKKFGFFFISLITATAIMGVLFALIQNTQNNRKPSTAIAMPSASPQNTVQRTLQKPNNRNNSSDYIDDDNTDNTDNNKENISLFKPDVVPSVVNGKKIPDTVIDYLVLAAVAQHGVTTDYNGAYQKLAYPNGDVNISTGVCTDVVIRAFRQMGVDLQKEIHKDMLRHFNHYPKRWGLRSPDSNIDHRRVPNMETYFTRKGYKISIATNTNTENYRPGDLVVWRISGKLTHIGIVSDEVVPDTSRYYIIHNPFNGVEISDWLDGEFEIINHFRVFKENAN